MLNTPILLITFNRPDHTRKVLKCIMAQHPKDLYVFQDGARNGNAQDVEKCKNVRVIINNLTKDTDTHLHTNYSNVNLGCGPGPAFAITWFFDNVDKGIIIEDDAVTHSDFYSFAEMMLQKYEKDESVFVIGSMCIDDKKYGDGSYYFSMMNRSLCAWATWKRAWQYFDYNLEGVTRKSLNYELKYYYHINLRMRECWCDRLDILHKDYDNGRSWDMQWFISIWMNHGKGIFPNYTLSSNIGFDESATHCSDSNNVASNRPLESILPLKHPTTLTIITKADINHDKIYTEPYEYGWSGFRRLPYRINKRLKRILKHKGPWFKN